MSNSSFDLGWPHLLTALAVGFGAVMFSTGGSDENERRPEFAKVSGTQSGEEKSYAPYAGVEPTQTTRGSDELPQDSTADPDDTQATDETSTSDRQDTTPRNRDRNSGNSGNGAQDDTQNGAQDGPVNDEDTPRVPKGGPDRSLAGSLDTALSKPVSPAGEQASRRSWRNYKQRLHHYLVNQAQDAGCDALRARQMRRVLADSLDERFQILDDLHGEKIGRDEMRRRTLALKAKRESGLAEILTPQELAALNPSQARLSVTLEEQGGY